MTNTLDNSTAVNNSVINEGNPLRPDILTVSGYYFSFTEPGQSYISIDDIAHALSNLCRFAGHTRVFYSVAQHSVMVSRIVSSEARLAGLLHDAAEAYIGDVTTPLKMLLSQYREIERSVEKVIFNRFSIPDTLSPEIKHADLRLLATERRDLMTDKTGAGTWPIIQDIEPLSEPIIPLSPKEASNLFLQEYEKIISEH